MSAYFSCFKKKNVLRLIYYILLFRSTHLNHYLKSWRKVGRGASISNYSAASFLRFFKCLCSSSPFIKFHSLKIFLKNMCNYKNRNHLKIEKAGKTVARVEPIEKLIKLNCGVIIYSICTIQINSWLN